MSTVFREALRRLIVRPVFDTIVARSSDFIDSQLSDTATIFCLSLEYRYIFVLLASIHDHSLIPRPFGEGGKKALVDYIPFAHASNIILFVFCSYTDQ